MALSILFVDEDEAILKDLPKELSKKFDVRRVASYDDALEELKHPPAVAAVFTEFGVGGGDCIEFLMQARKVSPDTVRIALSVMDDFADIQEAVNDGGIFRFLSKPCPPKTLVKTFNEAVRRFVYQRRESKAQKETLLGCIKVMVDILELVNPEAVGRTKRIRSRILGAGKILEVDSLQQLDLAVMLSHIGCVTLPGSVLEKMEQGQKLTPEETKMFSMHPRIAAEMLSKVTQMSEVADIIRHQREPFTPEQPLESRIFKVALDLDRLENKGNDPCEILSLMQDRPSVYDPDVVEAMLHVVHGTTPAVERKVSVEELAEGMVMAADLVNKEGTKLLLKGQAVSAVSLRRLQAFPEALGLTEAEAILINDGGKTTGACPLPTAKQA